MKKWLILSLNYEKNLNSFKKSIFRFKIIRYFFKVDQNVYKTANKSASMHRIKSFLAIGQSYLYDLSHTFLSRLKLLWGEIACRKRFVFYR